jgi:tyrosinase
LPLQVLGLESGLVRANQKGIIGRTKSSRESLGTAPVFSNASGFGGNGDPEAPESVSDGHCVTDGPFAGLQLPFYDGDDHIHCLSRGFKFDQKILHGHIPGEGVRPSTVEKILSLPDFESFFFALENGPHNAIPTGIHGDFMGFTAPNDPIFFLHHR